jgi:adenylate kinase family enzyme
MSYDEQLEKCYYDLDKKELIPQFKAYNKEFNNIISDINKQIAKIVQHIASLKRNKIVLLSGYPGSGKSTITNKMKEQGYKVLSLDDKIKNYNELVKKTQYYMKRKGSKNIVLDGTFLKQEQLDMFNWVNNEKNHDLITIYIDIPMIFAYFNNVKRCLDKRNKRTSIPYKTYESLEKNNTIEVPEKNSYVVRYIKQDDILTPKKI